MVAAWLSPAAEGATYWGGTIKGETYGETTDAPGNLAVLDRFEREAGKRVTMINNGQSWATFDTTTMQATLDAGAIPLVTMGLPSGVTLAEVAAGDQDTQIRAWATKAKEWGYPFLFRPWWEVNGTWYPWGRSPDYIAAWHHFHDVVEEVGATNVTWAWIVNNVWSEPESDPSPYYPGSAYVDWVGMDAYNWGLNPLQPDRWLTPEQAIDPTLKILRELAPEKPVCICEDAATEIGGNKESWIRDMLQSYLPHHPEIAAYLWFNWNVPVTKGHWDWPIGSSVPSQQAFHSGIQSSYYLSTLPPLEKLSKVPAPTLPPSPSPPGSPPPSPTLPDGHWTPSAKLETGEGEARDAQLAYGPEGTATVVWVELTGSHYAIQERRLGVAGEPQGAVQTLSEPSQDAFDPQVAVDPRGVATVVWKRFDGSSNIIEERRVLASGELESTVHELSAAGQFAAQPRVAAAPDGRAIVVWQRYSGYRSVIQERQVYYYDTPAGTTYTLSDGQQNAVEPRVAVDSNGNATVVWDRFDGEKQIVQTRRVDSVGVPAATTHDLSAAGEDAVEPSVAVGPDGTATAAWTRSDGANQIVEAQQISDEGVPIGSVGEISASGRPAVEPAIAVGPDGVTTVVWERAVGSHQVIEERRMEPDGSLEANTQTLSGPTQDSFEPQVAIGADGSAGVVWDETSPGETLVKARRVGPSGAPQATVVTLSPSSAGAGSPVIAAGPKGEAVAVWRESDGARDTVRTSEFGDPVVDLTPGSQDFGALEEGQARSQEFTIENKGNAPLDISALTISGAGGGQFGPVDIGSCGDRVLPSEACEFSVTFEPNSAGEFHGTLEALSDATSSPDLADLVGRGLAPPAPPEEPLPPKPEGEPEVTDQFSFGSTKVGRNGTDLVHIDVPGPGEIRLSAKSAAVSVVGKGSSPTDSVGGAGVVTVRLAARGQAREVLTKRGKVTIALRVTYTPTGGAPLTRVLRLPLRAHPHRAA